MLMYIMKCIYVACVNHLRRPPVHVGWSLVRVSLKWQQGSERKRSQEVEKGGEAGGAPPSPAAGDTHTHTQQGCAMLKGKGGHFCHSP